MAIHDHGDGDATREPASGGRPARRNARIALGAAGLAVVLGGGAYAITDRLTQDHGTPSDVAALAPASTSTPPDATADEVSPQALGSSPGVADSPPAAPSAARTASPTPSLPASVAAKIREARED